jgi:NDP-sugar pyrophosphorylase family protein
VHVINTALFQHIHRKGKFSMVDVYLDICAEQIIKGYDHTGGLLLDVGKPESLDKAASIFQ